jgi:hypothetical protein
MSNPGGQQTAGVSTYLVEHYWPGITAERFERAADQVRRSADAMARAGVRIRLLHSTLVPDDDAAFCVFEAESRAVVEEAYSRAGVPYERVLEALQIGITAASEPPPC